MKRVLAMLVSLLILATAAPAFADGVTKASAQPTTVTVGQKFTVTVEGSISPGKTCRVYLMRNTEQPTYKQIDTTSFPLVVNDFEFDKPGPGPNNTAFIHVYTGTIGPNACDGKSLPAVQVTVKAAGPQITAQAGRSAVQLAPNPCPPGWHVKAKEASGFLSCVPNKPPKLTCPPNTQYFETECAVGCQVVPR